MDQPIYSFSDLMKTFPAFSRKAPSFFVNNESSVSSMIDLIIVCIFSASYFSHQKTDLTNYLIQFEKVDNNNRFQLIPVHSQLFFRVNFSGQFSEGSIEIATLSVLCLYLSDKIEQEADKMVNTDETSNAIAQLLQEINNVFSTTIIDKKEKITKLFGNETSSSERMFQSITRQFDSIIRNIHKGANDHFDLRVYVTFAQYILDHCLFTVSRKTSSIIVYPSSTSTLTLFDQIDYTLEILHSYIPNDVLVYWNKLSLFFAHKNDRERIAYAACELMEWQAELLNDHGKRDPLAFVTIQLEIFRSKGVPYDEVFMNNLLRCFTIAALMTCHDADSLLPVASENNSFRDELIDAISRVRVSRTVFQRWISILCILWSEPMKNKEMLDYKMMLYYLRLWERRVLYEILRMKTKQIPEQYESIIWCHRRLFSAKSNSMKDIQNAIDLNTPERMWFYQYMSSPYHHINYSDFSSTLKQVFTYILTRIIVKPGFELSFRNNEYFWNMQKILTKHNFLRNLVMKFQLFTERFTMDWNIAREIDWSFVRTLKKNLDRDECLFYVVYKNKLFDSVEMKFASEKFNDSSAVRIEENVTNKPPTETKEKHVLVDVDYLFESMHEDQFHDKLNSVLDEMYPIHTWESAIRYCVYKAFNNDLFAKHFLNANHKRPIIITIDDMASPLNESVCLLVDAVKKEPLMYEGIYIVLESTKAGKRFSIICGDPPSNTNNNNKKNLTWLCIPTGIQYTFHPQPSLCDSYTQLYENILVKGNGDYYETLKLLNEQRHEYRAVYNPVEEEEEEDDRNGNENGNRNELLSEDGENREEDDEEGNRDGENEEEDENEEEEEEKESGSKRRRYFSGSGSKSFTPSKKKKSGVLCSASRGKGRNCGQNVIESFIYCSKHKCAEKECEKKKISGKIYCKAHSK